MKKKTSGRISRKIQTTYMIKQSIIIKQVDIDTNALFTIITDRERWKRTEVKKTY